MNTNLSQQLNNVLNFSREEAIRLGNHAIGTEHFMLGILREKNNAAVKILLDLNVSLDQLKKSIEDHVRTEEILKIEDTQHLQMFKSAERTLRLIHLEARFMRSDTLDVLHLLLAILKDTSTLPARLLADEGIDYISVLRAAKDAPGHSLGEDSLSQFGDEDDEDDEEEDDTEGENYYDNEEEDDQQPSMRMSAATKQAVPQNSSKTPVLDNFGIDLTLAAEHKQLDPMVGRNREIDRVVHILSRRKKNNPILIGEPGVGKSAIVEGLAMRIVAKEVSHTLFNKRIITLDLGAVVAGTKYRGQFEERIKSIIQEVSKNKNIILFIDEIHTLVGAGGSSGSLDAANMLKPALARGDIQCIGATTLKEYREHIEKDGALERRFQQIIIEPTSPEETLDILQNVKSHYESYHNVEYTAAALHACVSLSQRYISHRCFPDKGIDVLDEAGAHVRATNVSIPARILEMEEKLKELYHEKRKAVIAQNFEEAASLRNQERKLQELVAQENKKWEARISKNRKIVDEHKVAEVVSLMVNVPIQRIAQAESKKLIKMGDQLKGSVIGQNLAVETVVKAIQRNRAGLKDPNRPIGSFIFLGPTGVGKTLLAKVLTEYLFDTQDNLIRIDMSEYMEKFSVSRLVGAPPGYVGYEEGGILTEKVRRKPYSVLLFDEIEKAHPDVFNILLQVLDEGVLTDSLGRKVDFKNTIIIITSNIGAREVSNFGKGIGFTLNDSTEAYDNKAKGIILKSLKQAFTPEFLNRIDDIITFNSLTQADISKIVDIELKGLSARIEQLGVKLKVGRDAKAFIVKESYDSEFGARPLKRTIQQHLEDKIANTIIENALSPGDIIHASMNKQKSDIVIALSKASQPDVV